MIIATILPYKENYTLNGAGAVSLWIKDFMRDSKYKKNIFVFGCTRNKNYLTKNYININFPSINSRFYSTTKEYSKRIIIKLKKSHFDIIELHNRPVMVSDFVKKKQFKNYFIFS